MSGHIGHSGHGWREKEWDEPGPDFGKKYYVKRRPIVRPRPQPQPKEKP